uniref:Uncharacterized protein n=1 Tax=Ficedula albicollis TaxID=59894 RepID=A0A803VNM1_FICAL
MSHKRASCVLGGIRPASPAGARRGLACSALLCSGVAPLRVSEGYKDIREHPNESYRDIAMLKDHAKVRGLAIGCWLHFHHLKSIIVHMEIPS